MHKVKRIVLILLLPVAAVMLLVTLVFPANGRAAANGVLIAAVYYDGYESGEPDEAVQLVNTGTAVVDLSGWQLTDNSSTSRFPAGTLLPAGIAVWVTKDGAAFARQFGHAADYDLSDENTVPDLQGTWPGFSNSGDEVVLLDAAGLIVDVLVYENGDTTQEGWQGAALQPYLVSGVFAAEGQILYRKRDLQSGLPQEDTDSSADWAQETVDTVHGRKVLYPGWDLQRYAQTAVFTQTAVLTVAVAPDNAYETVVAQINSARESLQIEALTFENLGIKDALVAAAQRGVAVTVLLEEDPSGGIPDQEKYICAQLSAAGGACWFILNDSSRDIFDRYRFLHAKFILVDGQRAVISSENLSPNSLPPDDKSDGTWGRRGIVLVTDAPDVVGHLATLFQTDFDPAAHQDITDTTAIGEPPFGFEPNAEVGGITYTVRYPQPAVFQGEMRFEIVQSPENSLTLDGGLLGMLAAAGGGDTVLVQQLQERPYWGPTASNAVADPNLRLEAMIAAARRGAAVWLLLDGHFDDPESPVSNAGTCAYVRQIAKDEDLAIQCRVGNPAGLGIHNKMVLAEIDGRGHLHVGSINGTEASSKGNRELALQVQSDAAYAYLAELFFADWGHELFLPFVGRQQRAAAQTMLISEFLYDPYGSDDVEFIELVNPHWQAQDISGFALGDAVMPTDFEDLRRFPAGTIVAPDGVLVVATAADTFFAEYGEMPDFEILGTVTAVPDLIDDPAWGDPRTFLQLGNAGDEIILRDRQNQVVDAVAYGSGQFPGVVSCPLVTTGNTSYERLPYNQDSDDCAYDFREWPFPNPGYLPVSSSW